MVSYFEEKMGSAYKPPSSANEVALANEVRAYARALPRGKAFAFFRERLGDAAVLSAAISAPSFLSGLSDNEHAVLVREAAMALAPDEAKRKAELEKALELAEESWEAAKRKIAEVAGLDSSGPLFGAISVRFGC